MFGSSRFTFVIVNSVRIAMSDAMLAVSPELPLPGESTLVNNVR